MTRIRRGVISLFTEYLANLLRTPSRRSRQRVSSHAGVAVEVFESRQLMSAANAATPDAVGIFRNGHFVFDTGAPGYQSEDVVTLGRPGDVAVVGDWNGDGRDQLGVYRSEQFLLQGRAPIQFGMPGDQPLVGDWNGDGVDDPGVFRRGPGNNGWFLLDVGAPGWQGVDPLETQGFYFGFGSDLPVVGDWDGDGRDQVGVFRNGDFYLDAGTYGYQGEAAVQFGLPGDRPLTGDWDGDGIDQPGVYRNGQTYRDLGPLGYQGETAISFGLPGDQPIRGNWNTLDFGDNRWQAGEAIAEGMLAYSHINLVTPHVNSLPNSVQKSLLKGATDEIEGLVGSSLRIARQWAGDFALTGQGGSLDGAYQVDLDPVGKPAGWLGHIAFSRTVAYADQVSIADGQSGVEHLDSKFRNSLVGTASLQGSLKVHWGITVFKDAQGRTSIKVDDNSAAELTDMRGTFRLTGRGVYGALADVSLSGAGDITGWASYGLLNRSNGGLQSRPGYNLSTTLETRMTSHERFSNGVNWSVKDATRLHDNATFRRSIPQFTAPSALSLLRATLQGVNHYQVNLPILSSVQEALNIRVPFSSKTLAESIGISTWAPLVLNTVNPDSHGTFDGLRSAVESDSRYDVLIGGQSDALRFARGEFVEVLSLQGNLGISKSFRLAQTSLGTYVVYPGVVLSGNAAIHVTLSADLAAHFKIDSHGGGIREGTQASVALRLQGDLTGKLSILGYKDYALISGKVKAGAYVEGVVTATLGSAQGQGVYYLGSGAVFNPQRPLSSFVELKTELRSGVEVQVKVKVLGATIFKKDWDKNWTLAVYVRLPAGTL